MDKRNENKGKEHKKRIPLVETIQQNLTERKKPSGFLLSVLITTIKLFVIFLLWDSPDSVRSLALQRLMWMEPPPWM